MIKILERRLAEVGRIKIGGLDANVRTTGSGSKWQAPVKFNHFVVTSMERGKDGNFMRDESIHKKVGATPNELRIVLLHNDPELNFRTELAHYEGKACVCRGDGERAVMLKTGEEIQCPCPKLEQEKNGCKPHGVLNCILMDSEIAGGVWRFATTSWNTIRNIESSLRFMHMCTGGKIAGIPLLMRFYKKTATKPDGGATQIGVVGLFFQGNTSQLLDMAVATERKRLEAGIMLETLEDQVRREMQRQTPEMPLEEDEVPEFHPEFETTSPNIAPNSSPKPGIDEALKRKTTRRAAQTPAEEPEDSTTVPTEPVVPAAHTEPAATPEPVAPQPVAAPQEASAEPTPASTEPLSRETIVNRILSLRGKHKIMQGQFVALVARVIGSPKVNAHDWTDDEALRIHDAIVSEKEAKAA